MLKKIVSIIGLSLGMFGGSHADGYPDRPLTVIVPFSVGGNVDIVARLVNQKLDAEIGQPVITQNMPGASGIIGTHHAAKARPDGYTILANSSIHVISPSMKANMPYDPLADFVPISQITNVPMVLLVSSAVPAATLKEFLEWGRQQPHGVDYATYLGSAGHLAGELLKEETGLTMTVVAYKSGASMVSDVMGNQVPMMFDALLAASSSLGTGRVRALAVTSAQRSPMLPDVPTFAELGYPNVNAETWHGYWAPKGTPSEVVGVLSKAMIKIAAMPDVRKRIVELGGQPVGSTPEEFATFVVAEHDRWKALLERAGVKPE